ncbi:CHAP domain-containing protein [Deinococcus navajonensis]|uniref:CHAP domain-containing protein n=1 Tax=Deinococcus navajonensis TaxID=309884 RepID=A0ABV8XP96_9DEIO
MIAPPQPTGPKPKPSPSPTTPSSHPTLPTKANKQQWQRTFLGKGNGVRFQLRIIRDPSGQLLGRYFATPGSGKSWHLEGALREDNSFTLKGTENEAVFEGKFGPDGRRITTSFTNKTTQGEFHVEKMTMVFAFVPAKPLTEQASTSEPQEGDASTQSWETTITPAMKQRLPALAEPSFLKELNAVCQRLGVPRDLLLAVMAFESADSKHETRGLDPKADNGLGYYGLIQFGDDVAQDMGLIEAKKFKLMSATEQLPYVEKYLKTHGLITAVQKAHREGRNITLEELYMSVLAGNSSAAYKPFWKTKTANPIGYRNNRGLDSNADGIITPEEASDAVRLHWRDVFGNDIDERSRMIERCWYTERNLQSGVLERKWRVKPKQNPGRFPVNDTYSKSAIPAAPTLPNQNFTHAGVLKTLDAAQKRQIVSRRDWGAEIGSLDGIPAYYNDGVSSSIEVTQGKRNYSTDGKKYEYGLKWQCVEYVRRYYYDKLGITFKPRSGNAQDYFNRSTESGATNPERGLRQFRSGSSEMPTHQDLFVFGSNRYSSVGHVGIVANTIGTTVVIAQQNVGAQFTTTLQFEEYMSHGVKKYRLSKDYEAFNLLGWLRK